MKANHTPRKGIRLIDIPNLPADQALAMLARMPEFDNTIMAHAYESHGMPLPWQFRANQSLRTSVWLGRLLLGIDPKYDGVFPGTQHHALHDAQHEAEVLQAIIDNFRNFTP